MAIQKPKRSGKEIPLNNAVPGETEATDSSIVKVQVDKAIICIVGLGYVGLSLVEAFVKSLKVIGYDINEKRVDELSRRYDNPGLLFTNDP